MTTHRSVTIRRTATSEYIVTNAKNTQLRMGSGDTADFTPVELLLAAIGGCTAVDVDLVTSRRAEPSQFEVEVGAEKIIAVDGNHLEDITVTFRVRFPAGEDGDKARAVLPDIVRKSHDRLCVVGMTVQRGTPITPVIELSCGRTALVAGLRRCPAHRRPVCLLKCGHSAGVTGIS
jgi:putative redox protein